MAVSYLDKTGLSYFWGKVKALAGGKVDKENGKGLSTNDYTDAEKSKLGGIASGAEVNVQSDWNQTSDEADDFIKNKPTSMKNPAALTFGQKTYDGSEAKEITASDLGAITDISGKADKDSDAVEGNVSVFDANGNPVDSGSALDAILSAIQLLASGPQYNPSSQSVVFPVSSSAQYNASGRSVSFSTLNV